MGSFAWQRHVNKTDLLDRPSARPSCSLTCRLWPSSLTLNGYSVKRRDLAALSRTGICRPPVWHPATSISVPTTNTVGCAHTHTFTKALGRYPKLSYRRPSDLQEESHGQKIWIQRRKHPKNPWNIFKVLSLDTFMRTHRRDRCSKALARAGPSTRFTWWLYDLLQQAGERT